MLSSFLLFHAPVDVCRVCFPRRQCLLLFVDYLQKQERRWSPYVLRFFVREQYAHDDGAVSAAITRWEARVHPKRKTGTVYTTCGFDTGRLAHIFYDYFPQSSTISSLSRQEDYATASGAISFDYRIHFNTTKAADILVHDGGDCGAKHVRIKWLKQHFAGKIFFWNLKAAAQLGMERCELSNELETISDHPAGLEVFKKKVEDQIKRASRASTGLNAFMISSQPTWARNIYVYVSFVAIVVIGIVPPRLWPIILRIIVARMIVNTNININNINHRATKQDFFLIYVAHKCVKYRNRFALALSLVGRVMMELGDEEYQQK
jgi:hypothetical protein